MIKLFRRFFARQKAQENLIHNNYQQIDQSNLNMLRLTLIIGCVFFAIYFGISFVSEDYANATNVYLVVFSALGLLFFTYRRLHRHVSASALLYTAYTLVGLFSLYISAILAPDYPSITVLLYLFLIPLMILDKDCNILLFELAYVVAVFLFVIPLKHRDIRLDEYLNTLLFAVLALIFGSHVRASKFENFDLNRQAVIRERYDLLTDLENRRYLFAHLSDFERLRGMTHPIGLMMIDIDRFKLYNDTYGHQKGDLCLHTVGTCFKEFGDRYGVSFYRYGGEEFAGVAEDTVGDRLFALATLLSKEVCNLRIPHEHTESGMVTLSIGVADNCASTIATEAPSDKPLDFNMLIAHADAALYTAKAEGRNKVVAYHAGLARSSLNESDLADFRDLV